MSTLSAVSETALITLKARVAEAEKDDPVIKDEVGKLCLERLQAQLPADSRNRILDRKLPSVLTITMALRARKFDDYARTFIDDNPDGLVVSLGCGFDTRFWRVSEQPWNYIELDLPEVIAAKKEILGDMITYPTLGCSVLDEKWMAEIRTRQQGNILFLAEGLLMYLPKEAVIGLFNALSQTFVDSAIVFEVVRERYTKGLWKKMVASRMRRNLGIKAGTTFEFGVKNAKEVESYGDNIKVVEEWSYFDEDDIRPGVLRWFRHIKSIARSQWAIKARIG